MCLDGLCVCVCDLTEVVLFAGVRHQGSVCSACGEKDIYGMLWRCTQCKSCSLCSPCYFMDKHDISHVFERNDSESKRYVTIFFVLTIVHCSFIYPSEADDDHESM